MQKAGIRSTLGKIKAGLDQLENHLIVASLVLFGVIKGRLCIRLAHFAFFPNTIALV